MSDRITLNSSRTIGPSEYAKDIDGHWYAVTPTGLFAGLANHTIVEHEDGTITVSPSILVRAGTAGEWHGFLVHGVWSQV